jgi:hypothetical protein
VDLRFREITTRLMVARLRVISTRNYVKEVLAANIGGPDGSYAYLHAVRAETEALRNYSSVIREYKKFIEENPPCKERAVTSFDLGGNE